MTTRHHWGRVAAARGSPATASGAHGVIIARPRSVRKRRRAPVRRQGQCRRVAEAQRPGHRGAGGITAHQIPQSSGRRPSARQPAAGDPDDRAPACSPPPSKACSLAARPWCAPLPATGSKTPPPHSTARPRSPRFPPTPRGHRCRPAPVTGGAMSECGPAPRTHSRDGLCSTFRPAAFNAR